MKPLITLVLLLLTLSSPAVENDTVPPARKRINIVVSNKATRIDAALISTHIQAWWNQLFHRKNMRFLIVTQMEEAVDRISRIMEKENALIGNIWFDSHGHMGRRLALLEIGDVEINYQSISHPWINEKLAAIGRYCDSNSTVVLGSCYSSAGYISAGIDSFPPRNMNGETLIQNVAPLFNEATLYGSVSWITTKPGFFNSRYATAGHPWAKRFKDPRFMPAWDSLGVWKVYDSRNGLRLCNTVSMDHTGKVVVQNKAFLDIPKNKKKQQKLIKRLKKGNFSDKYFYEFRNPLHISNKKFN